MLEAISKWLDRLGDFFSMHLASNIGTALWLGTALWVVFLVVLVVPVLLFAFGRGWKNRRADILSNLSPRATALYLRNFQTTNQRDREAYDGIVDRELAPIIASIRERETRLAELRRAQPPDQAQITLLQNEIAQLKLDHPAAARSYKTDNEVEKLFSRLYESRVSKWLYVWPQLLLLVLAGLLLSYPVSLIDKVRLSDGAVQDWAWVIAFAILGGYTRVVYEMVLRYYQENIRPADLLWWCYRLIVSVPLGYAVGMFLNGGDSPRGAYAVAFLLGLFPTTTVTNIGRQLFSKLTKSEQVEEPPAQLKDLATLDSETILVIGEEGISTYTQLAYADPIRLTIRTGLNYSFVITAISEAMLLGYLGTRKKMDVVRLFGFTGGYEIYFLWKSANAAAGTAERIQADNIITEMATRLETTVDGLRNILVEVGTDPYLEFIVECWASNLS